MEGYLWVREDARAERASGLMSQRERFEPREARRWERERPIPDAAPVMAMVLLWK